MLQLGLRKANSATSSSAVGVGPSRPPAGHEPTCRRHLSANGPQTSLPASSRSRSVLLFSPDGEVTFSFQ